jgi:hypothetical protein
MKKIAIVSLLIFMFAGLLIGCSDKVDESISEKIEENPPQVLENGDYTVDLQDIGETNGVVFLKFVFTEDNNVYAAGDITSLPAAFDMEYVLSSGKKADDKDAFLTALGDLKECVITVEDGAIVSAQQTK